MRAAQQRPKTQEEQDEFETCLRFIKQISGSRGVRTKQAVEVGRRAVDYFRAVDFCKWSFRNKERLRSKVPEMFTQSVDHPRDAVALGERLLRAGLVYRANPRQQQVSGEGDSSDAHQHPDVNRPVKWPKRLEISQTQTFSEEGYFVLCYESDSPWRGVLLVGIILGVLLVCMFPAWPLKLKIAVWHLIVMFSSLMLIIMIVRLIVFVFLWFCGIDCWIFPNLFAEEAGVIDSFMPLHTTEWRRDTWGMFVLRICCACLTCLGCYQINKTHPMRDVPQFATQQLLDVLEWGQNKLAPPEGSESALSGSGKFHPFGRKHARGLKTDIGGSADVGPDEEEDAYSCLAPCGFQAFEDAQEECLTDCICMREILDSRCFKRCDADTRHALVSAQIDACAEKEVEEIEEERINETEPTAARPEKEEL